MSESAIWAMTEICRGAKKRLKRPMRAGSPTCCLRSLTRSALVAFMAGPRLKSIVARRQNKNVAASTVASGRNFTTIEKLVEASRPTELLKKKIVAPGADHEADRAAAKSEQTSPSQSNCLTICQRDAPTASRTAISFERAVPRASNMLARFRQAISNTAPAIAMSNVAINVIGPSSSGCVLKLKRDGV